jgi:hypothetical protein
VTNKEKPVVSIWSGLGHPAFDNEFLFSLENVEWWEQDPESDDIIDS